MGLIALILLAVFVLPAHADAFELAIQDQGADPAVLQDTASQLGIRTARILVRPVDPQTDLIRTYRRAGLRVQGAIIVKQQTKPLDVLGVVRAWSGLVEAVSIGNEPELNGVPACTYARLYARAYRLIRREFPRIRVGIREASPFTVVEYTQQMSNCLGGRDGALSNVRRGGCVRHVEGGHESLHIGDQRGRGRGRAAARSAAGRAQRLDIRRRSRRRSNCKRPSDHRSSGQLKADFFAIHPYCPDGDPLAPCQTRFQGGYTGIGNLGRVYSYLHARGTRSWLTTPKGGPVPIRVTEFSYFAGRGDAAWLWPRAIRQARRFAQQLVIYGLGAVHKGSAWPSATLIDAEGCRMPAFIAIARANGRLLRRWCDPEVTEPLFTPPPGPEKEIAPLIANGASSEPQAPVDEGSTDTAPTPVEDAPMPVAPAVPEETKPSE